MKKKLLAFVLALACTVGTFGTATVAEQPVTVEAATKKAPTLSKVYNAVKKAYGKDYLPDVRLKKNQIKEIFGVSDSWYSGVIAETRMINIQAEDIVIVKAKNANAKKKIKNALNSYRKNQIEQERNYVNYEKRLASRVYVKGNYVCYICLGTVDKTDKSEEELVEAYKKEVAKAVDAINKLY